MVFMTHIFTSLKTSIVFNFHDDIEVVLSLLDYKGCPLLTVLKDHRHNGVMVFKKSTVFVSHF